MSHRTGTQRRSWKERALSLLLAAALAVGLMPGLTLPASAEHWANAYLDQLVDWGVIRADQTTDPDSELTRAEFAAIVNRAYGYNEKGPIPFEDVVQSDWFYDDISIAYTAGYMLGTSATTASPNDTLTREQAVCILGRNMMMKETPGETLAFADGRDISDWARGTIKTAVDSYIVSGYPDNTFHPKDAISRGQMAALITQCIGNPIQKSGDFELGGVFGNVTITAPNVTLRNTTISGDLYISGGVGLGGIKLENVDVLGRIIVSGTGESEGGAASVIMRNVTAEEMLVDNMRNKTVTIRADGITNIANTVVRTNAYIEDNNTDEEGLLRIELDGELGTRLTLAGRIKEVVNKTPGSYIQEAKGTVAKLTVDEAATNSIVEIDRNTKINELNLDVATDVIGDGDLGQLNINAPGSVVTMLPDKIYVRPGLTASIAGVIMDYQAAEEGSLDPRLLSGYPAAKDIAPTGFRADFAGNKKGTVYWAVSYVSDGSVGEEALITPPSYGSKAIANGSVAAPTGGGEVSAQVANLVVGGSYYLSAILVDDQNNRSPVKVISFSTPDNTVPAFGQGYPYMSRIKRDVAQVTVMPTKSCKLYYALLPQGAQAPTANDLKAAAVAGNLGYGVRDVTKNTEEVFTVNSQRLEELKTYVLYLWLSDVDGANSSAVQSLTFTIPDETRPVVDPVPYPAPDGTAGTSVSMRTGLSEAGIVFWAVVKQGTPYPLPNMQSDPLTKDNEIDSVTGLPVSAKLDTDYARLGVSNGRGSLARGQVNVANASTEVSFNVTGLEPETAYDLYYVGRDTAGNYSEKVGKITIKTQDTNGPIVRQYFTNYQGADDTERPMANTDVILYFNEDITISRSQDLITLYETSQGRGAGRGDADAQKTAGEQLLRLLRENVKLWQRSRTGTNSQVADRTVDPDAISWIDYRYIVIRRAEDGKGTEIVFPNGERGAISLASDTTYYFELTEIRDNADPMNTTVPVRLNPTTVANSPNTEHVLKEFHTVFAQVNLARGQSSAPPEWQLGQSNEAGQMPGSDPEHPDARVDASFYVTPQSTKDAGDTSYFDIVFFADRGVSFDLYYRIVDTKNLANSVDEATFNDNKLPFGTSRDKNGWSYLGNKVTSKNNKEWETGDLNINILRLIPANYPKLKNLGEGVTYEFAISVTRWEGIEQYESWDDKFNFHVYMVAGSNTDLYSLLAAPNYTPETIMSGEESGVYSIGVPDYVTLPVTFVASAQPLFASEPNFGIGDTFKEFTFGLDNPGTLYYMIVPKEGAGLQTKITVTENVTDSEGNVIEAGTSIDTSVNATVSRKQLWDVVSAQMGIKDGTIGKLLTDAEYGEHLRYYRVDGVPDRDLIPRGQGFISGSLKYEYMGGVPQPFTIPGEGQNPLTPETEYYIYIVLEAESGALESRSNVYIFNFETTATDQPKIYLTTSSGNGRVTVSTTNKPEITSNIAYALFTASELERNDIFNSKLPDKCLFSAYVKENLRGEYAALNKGSSYQVINALIDGYNGTNESIFDHFATDAAKIDVSSLIRTNSAGSPLRGTITVPAAGSFTVDRTAEMLVGDYYYLLAVGTHISGTTEGFRAIDNVVVPDLNPPQIMDDGRGNVGLSTALRSGSVKLPSDGSAASASGIVTITFDKPVYWIESYNSSAIRYPVYNSGSDTSTSGVAGKAVLDVVGNPGNLTLVNGETRPTSAANEFRFQFTDWVDGDRITFFSGNGRIANSGGQSFREPLTLTLRLTKETNPTTGMETVRSAVFEATWVDANGVPHKITG